MQKQLLFLSLTAFTLLSSCHDHSSGPTASFTLNFKAVYDGEQMTKYKTLPYGNPSYPLQLTRFNTYLSDIELLKADGSSHRLSEIEFVDFTPDNSSSDLSATPSLKFEDVPEGEYTGIRIGYGVKPSLNAKSPAQFSGSHPLARENEYWSGWDSYIFNKIEGQADADNNGSYEVALLYHCGSDAVYKTYTFTTPISVFSGHTGHDQLSVVFDLKKVFLMADGSYYDIATNFATSNNPADISVATVLMANFEQATSVQQ